MSGKYILRLDDACPTMDSEKWQRIEEICDKYHIKPIVAVIPNNEDKSMEIDEYNKNFWDKIRSWQKKEWHIALHGYNHKYITHESGFLPFNKASEFAGLSYDEQAEKIKKGWKIFEKENVKSNIWIAPSHTFDLTTLNALKENTSIAIISDGIAIFPFQRYGFNWIPQQIWKFRKMPFGIWTGCFHPNTMNDNEFENLEDFIKENKNDFINLKDFKFRKFCILNKIFYVIYNILYKLKKNQ